MPGVCLGATPSLRPRMTSMCATSEVWPLLQISSQQQQRPGNHTFVCVGDEWHRFPSSFFLPSPEYRLAFLQSSFKGLLPRSFSLDEVSRRGGEVAKSALSGRAPARGLWRFAGHAEHGRLFVLVKRAKLEIVSHTAGVSPKFARRERDSCLQGGTAAASPFLNDQNREEPANYWKDAQRCSYLVELQKRGDSEPEGVPADSFPWLPSSEGPDEHRNSLLTSMTGRKLPVQTVAHCGAQGRGQGGRRCHSWWLPSRLLWWPERSTCPGTPVGATQPHPTSCTSGMHRAVSACAGIAMRVRGSEEM